MRNHFGKDHFGIDLATQTVTCPARITTTIRHTVDGIPGSPSSAPPVRTARWPPQCTTAKAGRTITTGHYETQLAIGRARQADPGWKADYRATRPKVERKIGHLMRRHGGRRDRVRGLAKVAADFSLLAATVNLARLFVLRIAHRAGGWTTATA